MQPATDHSAAEGLATTTIRAAFLDRDNTLTRDRGYTHRIEDFEWVADAPPALRRLSAAGFALFVVTNQGGVGLGLYAESDIIAFHQRLAAEALKQDAAIVDFAYCPHHPEAIHPTLKTPCVCRKPEPGMLLQLSTRWSINLQQSIMIGDRLSDVEAGNRAGCRSYLFDGGSLDRTVKVILDSADP